MRVRAISGYGRKGPACFLVETGGRRLLLDLGAGPDHEDKPHLDGIGAVDAILVSHGHGDHVGALDLAPRVGAPPVYATAAVRALADDAALKAARDLPVGASEVLGIAVLTGRDGHAPGGVWLRLGGPAGLLYTGDFSVESALWPFDPMPEAALLVMDASYGDYDGTLAEGAARLIARAAAGPLLLPAPRDGRGLEMALTLSRAGLAVRLCVAHRAAAETLLAATPEAVSDAGQAGLAALLEAPPLLADSEPAGVMIAAAAGAARGTAAALAERWADDPSVGIVFTGHLPAGSPAERLVATGRATFQRWNVHPRAGDLGELLARTGARTAMPAFLDAAKLDALRRRLDHPAVILSPAIGDDRHTPVMARD